jgi:hypothetical protein
MKTARKPQVVRHAHRIAPLADDPYRELMKGPDPATCPRCRATYRAGHWSWRPAPPGAVGHKCPSCRRLEDNFPAGYVTLKGPFFTAHRDEVLDLVMARAERALAEHPLKRIIGVQETPRGLVVTTTDPHLARGIGVALRDAFKGTLEISFARDEPLVRATWSR